VTHRIVTAIVGVTAFVLLVLGIPLAIVVQRYVVSAETVELEATSASALNEIVVPIDPDQLAALASEADSPPPFTVYDATGRLVFGDGPQPPDRPVVDALAEQRVVTSSADGIVVATPITDDAERLQGVLRLSEGPQDANQRTRTVWAVMAASALAAIAAAWFLARRLARQLAAPIEQLADRADALIEGVDRDDLPRSGIDEIDHLADALHASSSRVADALARERRFSADVSHQLRTPLAAIRLKLESAGPDVGVAALAGSALDDLDRIDATVEQLVALARSATPVATPTPIVPLLGRVAGRWGDVLGPLGRELVLDVGADLPAVVASANTIDQILDVLVDNAVRHGVGDVTITTRQHPGGVVVDVADEGHLSDHDSDDLFRRRDRDGHGIGLSLARALAEAEDARLRLTSRQPTTFSLFLVAA
jgi:signal transduction histidine kinase